MRINNPFFLFILYQFCALNVNAQNWQQVGSGFDDAVYTLYADTAANTLYASGFMQNSGNTPVKRIARFNGTDWDSMASGSQSWASSVRGIVKYNGNIYASGYFIAPFNYVCIAKWNGNSWDSVASVGIGGAVWDMHVYNNEMYVTGQFTSIGGMPVNDIAKFDGTTWTGLANDTTWSTPGITIEHYNGELYAGGNFYHLTSNTWRLMKWNGTYWEKVGNSGIYGLSAGVTDMQVYNGELYVAGEFYTSDGNVGNSIQKWNGTSWSDVGGGITAIGFTVIWKLRVHNGKIYAVGVFTEAGGVPIEGVASWDGLNWCGYGFGSNSAATDIAFLNGEMYVGGGFTLIGNDTINYIAKWTGNKVDTCGNSTSINEMNADKLHFSLFPNPSTGIFTLQKATDAKATVVVYDVLGNQCLSLTLSQGERTKQIDLTGLPKGIYHLQLTEGDKVYSQKIVLQ